MAVPCGSHPAVIRGGLCGAWEPVGWSLDQWAALLGSVRPLIGVRIGQSRPAAAYGHPQWERLTEVKCYEFYRILNRISTGVTFLEFFTCLTFEKLWRTYQAD